MRKHKLLDKALNSPTNLQLSEMVALIKAFGFHLSRTTGSHHIFVHQEVRELVNIQDVNGGVKPYQVRQFLRLVERYNLTMGGES